MMPNTQVSPQVVIQMLSNKITSLIVENVMLQARNNDLENQLKQTQEVQSKKQDEDKANRAKKEKS